MWTMVAELCPHWTCCLTSRALQKQREYQKMDGRAIEVYLRVETGSNANVLPISITKSY